MPNQDIRSGPFRTEVSLGDAYRIMYRFLQDVEQRGPGAELWWILYAYAGINQDDTTMDPAAADDFLAAARAVLPGRIPEA